MNASELRAFVRTPAFTEPAAAYLAKKLHAEVMREEVDAYLKPIWDGFGFKDKRTGEVIAHHNHAYRAEDDSRMVEFYAACDRAHAEHGHQLQPGYCPALCANRDLVTAEHVILKACAGPLGFDYDSLVCHMDIRERMLELITSLAANVMLEQRRAA
jgi:hypothetical protein